MAAAANGGWAHAVPLDESNGFIAPQRADTFNSQEARQSSRYVDRSRSASRRRPSDYGIMSDSEATGSRRASIRASNSHATRKRSRNALREKRDERRERIDDSAWIHRDKLAQIEIQEMEEAGIHVRQSRRSTSAGPGASGRTSRSQSHSSPRLAVSEDKQVDGDEDEEVEEGEEQERQRPLYSSFDDYKRVSTIPAEDEEEQAFDPVVDSEIRTPEEVAAEHFANRPHTIRPSTSRIPISKVSPVPVPQQVVDRDSPLPRSRTGSGARVSGGWDDLQYARKARSNSIASQVLFDDADGVQTPSRPNSSHLRSSNENSPPKSRLPSKATPTSGARKGSGTNGTSRPGSSHLNKARTPSAPTKQRPGSSGGHKMRPSTSHAPEGEAPWISTMYKPDPRLPPDQQMLPTHAKRMMQEQWERDGKTGTAYDRHFNLLNDTELEPKQDKSKSHSGLTLDEKSQWTMEQSNDMLTARSQPDKLSPASPIDQPWPLSPAKSDTKSETPSRPGTSGGYKITPTINTPPPIQRPSAATTTNAQPHNPTPRVPDYDEKDVSEPKKGCCCVIM